MRAGIGERTEMIRKEQLIEFRRKLVRAKELAPSMDYELHTLLEDAGFSNSENARIAESYFGGRTVWDWNYAASPMQRIAMWDNSIAHVNKLIKECK